MLHAIQGRIVAIGGGGLGLEEPDFLLSRYLLRLTGLRQPRVCFLPQASAEQPQYIERFFETFTRLGAEPSWQSLFGRVDHDWHARVLAQDLIYVGGGNTRSLLALWRDWGMDTVLREALARGTLLAGSSAGAICWFEECVTDSLWPLVAMPGLGWLPGSACPHYDGEPERRPTLRAMLQAGQIGAGIALGDYTAACYVDGRLEQVVAATPSAQAWRVACVEGQPVERELPAVELASLLAEDSR